MNKEEYSFIIEFDEMAKKQMASLTDFFNNNKIKIQVLKSNYDLKKQEKLENALDEIEKYINKAQLGEFPDGVIYWLKDDEVGKNLLEIIKKAKGK